MEKVSIVIPTYNSGQYISDTLESVFKQTYKNIEIILVDDGSTDNTKEVIQPYLKNIVYISQKNSGGPAKPRNVGIEHSTSNFVSFLDADDIFEPDKIEKSIELFKLKPSLGMVFNNFEKIDVESKKNRGKHIDENSSIWHLDIEQISKNMHRIKGESAFEELLKINFIGTSGVVVRKDVFKTVGDFDEAVTLGGLEDRDMWIKIAKSYDIGYVDKVMHTYYIRDGSVSRRPVESSLAKIMVIKRYTNENLPNKTKKILKKNISKWYSDIGKHYSIQRQRKSAYIYYFKSFLNRVNLRAIKGIIKTTIF